MSDIAEPPAFSIGQVAERIGRGVKPWHIRQAIARGFLPAPARAGCYRIFPADQLPDIERALRKAGYLNHRAGFSCTCS